MEGNRSSQTPATSEAPPTPTADQSELIKSENPELLKVLSEEPYAGDEMAACYNFCSCFFPPYLSGNEN